MLHAFGRFVFDFGMLAIGWIHSGTQSGVSHTIVHTLDCILVKQ